jgi:hypothetical protein
LLNFIIQDKPPPPPALAPELSNLVTHFVSKKFKNFNMRSQFSRNFCSSLSLYFLISKKEGKCTEISSFSEAKAADMAANQKQEVTLLRWLFKDFATSPIAPLQWIEYNIRQMSRVYPSGNRVGSSNYDPTMAFNCGAQVSNACSRKLFNDCFIIDCSFELSNG